MSRLAPSFAAALERDRPRYNALFAEARRATPNLDGGVFAEFLAETVDPIIARVAEVAPDRVSPVVDVLYEFALVVIGKGLCERYPAIADGWRAALGGLPSHLAQSPRRFAGSVTNALCALSQVPGARPGEWFDGLARLGSGCPDADALLEAGKVLAWRAGMAHYREPALDVCRRLPPSLARAALGLPPAEDALDAVLDRLAANPWLHPEAAAEDSGGADAERRLEVVSRYGAFRGFGGQFLNPPRVASDGARLYVMDSEGAWALSADVFGATLQRVGEAPAAGASGTSAFTVSGEGTVGCGAHYASFPELRERTSAASTESTLAVTVPYSHCVYLVALVA